MLALWVLAACGGHVGEGSGSGDAAADRDSGPVSRSDTGPPRAGDAGDSGDAGDAGDALGDTGVQLGEDGAMGLQMDDTFACLDQMNGPLLDLLGTVNVENDWFNLPDGVRFDARGETFTSETFPVLLARYPVDIRIWDGRPVEETDACWAGGVHLSTNPVDMTWRESKTHGGGGMGAHNVSLVVDGARIHNAHDGIGIWTRDGGRPEIYWQVRNTWMSYNRDDCIEDDFYFGGLVEDSLFDGCFVFLSTRGGTTEFGQTVTVQNSLIRMQKMPGPIDGSDASVMAHGEIFKTNEYGPDVAVQNNIFLVEGLAMTSADPSLWPTQNGYLLGFKNVVSCSNNVIVWLGDGDLDGDFTDADYPGNIPDDPACVTVTRDRSVWDDARARWLVEHPGVPRIPGVDE